MDLSAPCFVKSGTSRTSSAGASRSWTSASPTTRRQSSTTRPFLQGQRPSLSEENERNKNRLLQKSVFFSFENTPAWLALSVSNMNFERRLVGDHGHTSRAERHRRARTFFSNFLGKEENEIGKNRSLSRRVGSRKRARGTSRR